jgi:hypothetical protein
MFAVVSSKDPNQWMVFRHGGRLDHWGPIEERATYSTLIGALSARHLARARKRARVVRIPENPTNLHDYTVVVEEEKTPYDRRSKAGT